MSRGSSRVWLVALVALCLLVVGGCPVLAEVAAEPTVTMMLFETDIREALSEISMQTGVNVIPDQNVSGVVTADLVDVPLEKALRIITIGGGYTFRKIDDFYLVGLADPRSTTFGELVETEVYRLTHVDADTVLGLLPTFLQSYVRGMEGNVLTISAPPTELARIKELLRKLDSPRKQIEVKVVVTEVSTEAAKELGNTLLMRHPDEGHTFEDINGTVFPSRSFAFSGADNLLTINADVYGSLLARLKLLQEDQKARVHADPKVLLADGEEAELFSGEQQILLISSEDDDFTDRVERIEVGVTLNVTANVVGEDEVILQIAPEVSHFVGQARPDLIVKQNSLSTTIRLKSGQTAMLAGLTVQDDTDYTKKVPVLGDIPLIRWLFRMDKEERSDKELLVFVTPVIQ